MATDPSAPTTDAPTDAGLQRIQEIADGYLRGRLKGRRADATVEVTVTDLLTITCIAASLQQDARLRGGATAPTPDPTADAALLTEVATVRRLAQSRGYEGLYDLLGRIDRRLRQDTGGAYGE